MTWCLRNIQPTNFYLQKILQLLIKIALLETSIKGAGSEGGSGMGGGIECLVSSTVCNIRGGGGPDPMSPAQTRPMKKAEYNRYLIWTILDLYTLGEFKNAPLLADTVIWKK